MEINTQFIIEFEISVSYTDMYYIQQKKEEQFCFPVLRDKLEKSIKTVLKVKNYNYKLEISEEVGTPSDGFSCVVVSHEVDYF